MAGYIDDLIEVLTAADVKLCFWAGLAPCPICDGDHGAPDCTPERDVKLRAMVSDNAAQS